MVKGQRNLSDSSSQHLRAGTRARHVTDLEPLRPTLGKLAIGMMGRGVDILRYLNGVSASASRERPLGAPDIVSLKSRNC